jgi:transaldolase/glucose-6-phosphate isomerase
MTSWEQLPQPLRGAVGDAATAWDAAGSTARLWARDATLWTDGDEARWLGWLSAPAEAMETVPSLAAFAAEVRAEGFTDVLLLGMGGSSLCPEVLAESFGPQPGSPRLHVLDSTDPAQVAALERTLPLARTLMVVASKSGSTLEPNIFNAYFFERVKALATPQGPGRQFVAITDPGSKLETAAARDGFRRVFAGVPSIGGRYSALSPFGLVPAALIGLDLARWVGAAQAMAERCRAGAALENPGVALGVALGVGAREGKDKLTLIVSPRIYDLGAWLEQLVAESTGKNGTAIIPVDREPLGPPTVYGTDRLFVYLRLTTTPDDAQDRAVESLVSAGASVLRIDVPDAYALAAEFFRWQIATAVAGAVLGINPFDQPDVEASKIETRKLTDDVEKTGRLPEESPVFADEGLTFFTDTANAATLGDLAGEATAASWIRAHLSRLSPGDYLALLAYVPMTAAHERTLTRIRTLVRDARRVATAVGFGPRFLHSTGQAYKGGPNSGVFLQITCEDARDLPVPHARYTFGVVKAAQARGDFQVLVDRQRRALRVHLGPDVAAGLHALERLVAAAVAR